MLQMIIEVHFSILLAKEKTECLPVIFCTGGGSIISFLSFLKLQKDEEKKTTKIALLRLNDEDFSLFVFQSSLSNF